MLINEGYRLTGTTAAVVLLLGALTSCTVDQQGRGTGGSTVPATTSALTTTSVGSTSASRTPREIPPLPDGAKIDPFPCEQAQFSMQAAVTGWFSVASSYVQHSREIPASSWDEISRVMPTFKETPLEQRPQLIQAGVPETHVVIKDLDAFVTAVDEALIVAQTQNRSRVMEVDRMLQVASEDFFESCDAVRE